MGAGRMAVAGQQAQLREAPRLTQVLSGMVPRDEMSLCYYNDVQKSG